MIRYADEIQTALGLDVSQDSVTLFDSVTGQTLTIANETQALTAALDPLRNRDLAVCEATGGHEDKLLAVLCGLAIPVHRGDAAKIKAYIRSFGKRAKTDPIDARWLSRYAIDRSPGLMRWQPPEPCQAQISLLVSRRLDLVAMKRQETNRLKAPRGHLVADDIRDHIADLEHRIRTIEVQIEELINQHRDLSSRARALRSIPGVAAVLAPLLIATMPELGSLNRRQAASLAGCAPHPRDSGKLQARRHSSGGRRQIRPALFIAALAAARGKNPLADFYNALVRAGKPKRLALAALMRKIICIANARIRDAANLHPQLT
ncbi:IS110 family transposase [Rhizorhabdus wittichii]|uniref:IS110 family transposase n=1 Tax=Rhizorhabdus wittichii TaxID=160791 RepID=UPI0003766D1F|nr:IS110 family transposase [Rhizorhabdus wittichii]